jgi:hypothetical protein
VTIYLDDRRLHFADLVSKLQHATAGFPLLLVAAGKLADESERPIAIFELILALAILVAFARDVRATIKHHHSHDVVGWFDLAAGVLLIYEAFHGAHHKPGYMRPQFLAGVVTLTLGLFHTRLHGRRRRRRYLTLDEKGLEMRTSPIRKVKLAWTEIASVDLAGDKAVIRETGGRAHTLRLKMLNNHDEVRKGIAEAARAAGVGSEAVS